jgi:hypothetical protein
MDRNALQQRLDELRAEVVRLEGELAAMPEAPPFKPPSFYLAYHVLAGFVLGMFGAATSLLFNIVGSVLVGQHPLQLIRVYLTFPLGETALELGTGKTAVGDNFTLAIGCCLYLGTGMVLGIPFHVVLARWLPQATFPIRLAIVTVLALALWIVNFYVLLSWLQPLLFGGNWIVALIPPWVAALTHLVFGWTMLMVEPLGRFTLYQPVGLSPVTTKQ